MTRDPDPVHTFAEARELALESGGTPPRQCESCGYERHSVSWFGVSAENEDLAPIRGEWSCESCYLRTLAVVTGKPWRVCDCGDYWCDLHYEHAHLCGCPPIEEWGEQSPYQDMVRLGD